MKPGLGRLVRITCLSVLVVLLGHNAGAAEMPRPVLAMVEFSAWTGPVEYRIDPMLVIYSDGIVLSRKYDNSGSGLDGVAWMSTRFEASDLQTVLADVHAGLWEDRVCAYADASVADGPHTQVYLDWQMPWVFPQRSTLEWRDRPPCRHVADVFARLQTLGERAVMPWISKEIQLLLIPVNGPALDARPWPTTWPSLADAVDIAGAGLIVISGKASDRETLRRLTDRPRQQGWPVMVGGQAYWLSIVGERLSGREVWEKAVIENFF